MSFWRICTLCAFLLVIGCKSFNSNGSANLNTTNSALTSSAQIGKGGKLGSAAMIKTTMQINRLAFGSCADPTKPQPIWKIISNQHPQLWVGLGDNVYTAKANPFDFATAYSLQLQNSDYNEFRMQVPQIATWDDNDYGANDGGKENPQKEKAKQAFMEFFPNDAMAIDPHQGGVYHSFILGSGNRRVQIILLDTRYFRDSLEANKNPKSELDIYQATQDKTKTILGEEQWKWLEKELQKPAELRLIASSIQLIAADHGFEKWANFPHEKQRFFDLLEKYKLKNTFVVSGDRHAGEISKIHLHNVGDLYDVTASGLNKSSTLKDETNSARIGTRSLQENFGIAEINWKKKKVSLKLINLDGKDFSSVNFKLH